MNWTFDNIPPMKEEPYTSTIDNYIGCIKFQLAIRPLQPGHSERLIRLAMGKQPAAGGSDFGLVLQDPNPWIVKLAKSIVQPDDPDLEKAHKIYAYTRDHLKAESKAGGYLIILRWKTSIKRAGNTAEINLLLIALLKTQKLNAEGVILATRDNGLTNVSYPVMDNFNYAICRLEIAGKVYFLDASDQTMGLANYR